MPTTLVALELTLRAEHDPVRQGHIAHLAGRLGYSAVWLPIDSAAAVDPDALEMLALAAQPAVLGLLPTGRTDALASWLATTPAMLVELPVVLDDTARAALMSAAGGVLAWRERMRTRDLDLDAAGHVVHAPSREDAHTALARALRARFDAGRAAADYPLVVGLPVSIGRTMSEAAARALRDPALAEHGDPREAGLFGTLEQAQDQALALARAGADAIRATLADEADVTDLLAQLRSVAVGPTPLLHAKDGG
ncbi:MAG TPA: hypothetical protein VKE25_02955 [Actinomycetes bacterium]|nr:hypothetical protein [Actinomycetes bacterium]